MNRLEKIILKNLIYNEDFTRKVLPFLHSDYFHDNTEKNVFKEVYEFVNTYKTLPTHEALVINFTEKKQVSANEVSQAIDLLNEIHQAKDEPSESQWLINQTEKFCQDKAIYNAVMESVMILDDKNQKKTKGEIPKLLSDALGVSFDNNIGHDYIDDYSNRYDSYHRVESRVKLDLDLLNKITGGGFPVKTLNVFMSTTGGGKSLTMCHIAASCISQGYNVLYITMEMSEEKIAERIDANLLNIPINELHTIPKKDYERKFGALRTKTQGKLIIKEYPTAAASSLHFRALLNDLALKKNFRPQIIFIDYLNICMSARVKQGAAVNSYTYIKSIAEELRGLAVEQNIPIVSATQSNRAGHDNSDVDLTNTSESFGLPATVDWMVALIGNEELDQLNQIMVKQLKNRYCDPSMYKRFVLGIDKSKMRLYDLDPTAQKNLSDSGQPSASGRPAMGTPIDDEYGIAVTRRKFGGKFDGVKV